jgi:hypothetical protein
MGVCFRKEYCKKEVGNNGFGPFFMNKNKMYTVSFNIDEKFQFSK